MAIKKKNAEPMKNPTAVKSPVGKKSSNGITPAPASCNPDLTGTGKNAGTFLDRARAYFFPAKEV